MDIEVLSVKDYEENPDVWYVDGVVGYNSFAAKNAQNIVKASKNALTLIQQYLDNGQVVYVPKNINGIEVVPSDIIVKDQDDLECAKNVALRVICNQMHENLLGADVITSMDYLNCYMKLLAAGIFITDRNREDKYFEIIEAAQENEMPEQLQSDCTFEQEQEYLKKKKAYESAQDNLNTLEKYLNAYDKLAKINFTNNYLTEIKENIQAAETHDEVNALLKKYKDSIVKYQTN